MIASKKHYTCRKNLHRQYSMRSLPVKRKVEIQAFLRTGVGGGERIAQIQWSIYSIQGRQSLIKEGVYNQVCGAMYILEHCPRPQMQALLGHVSWRFNCTALHCTALRCTAHYTLYIVKRCYFRVHTTPPKLQPMHCRVKCIRALEGNTMKHTPKQYLQYRRGAVQERHMASLTVQPM